MKRLVVASNNQHKIEEIKAMLSKYNISIISLKEAGLDIDVEEDGNTFMENAYKKAFEISKILKDDMILADDSGLMVDALGGAPGIYSARFSGEHGNYKKNNEKLKALMLGKPKEERKAQFVCAMVLIAGKKQIIKVHGSINGYIIEEEKGHSGFGYDPLFYVPEYGLTFAEMDASFKNKISHRRKALEKLDKEIKGIIQEE
ncbi:XTP/dITP diphosphatase [Clostridium sp. JN-9]|uniref:XTP/dITP diphosphatase n=1 Tax=Clostridium sp. JN-9 TaxID=2507159 RepID=UPI000FFE1A9A|nr:XTP/dITP diphosphatase [Clostridium sp. JN-9]QAT39341.1 XTP/dITP diphosphatase [Clostridium sp. JN-9]